MKIKSVLKYNISNMIKSLGAFYAIFIFICVALTLIMRSSGGNFVSSGLELSSAIFIFVVGLNSFKENFYFMKSNNVSRKDFIYGTAASIIPIAFIMSFIDVIINRIYNVFVSCPTNYDMIYGNMRDIIYNNVFWKQSNSFETLINTFLFQGVVYAFAFAIGFVITILYYKSNSLTKVIISVVPVAFIIFSNLIIEIYPSFFNGAIKFIQFIFGWNTLNPYAGILTFIILYIILVIISRLLTRKAVLK
ncbi:hypothetical protein [Clostridium tertium]|uniref:ABC-2 family transporter protein n=1 Tax=Clostridium tertium TaxID=1559 RepID=A0A6N3FU15_9CLOT